MKTISIAVLALLVFWAGPSHAASSTVQVQATMRLTSGCIVNNILAADGVATAEFGRIDFGGIASHFSRIDGLVSGTGSGISIKCSQGVSPVMIVGSGLHDGLGPSATGRAMKLDASKRLITAISADVAPAGL